MFEDAMTSTFLQYETADFSNKISTTSHQLIWWLGTESNRVHWLFRPALSRRVPEPNLVDGARLELALHGCRPWVIPLYEPPIWGEMRESNSRNWSHNPAPKPFGQSRHHTWSWSSESNTRRRGTSSLHFHCARPANFGAGTQPRTAVGRLPCACSSR